MAVNSIIPPYASFFEVDGTPLENGSIYVGQPGFEAQSSPKASFFDFALTIPTGTETGAAVATTAGFPVRNGSAAALYVDGDFSITVRDRNGVLLYSALNRTFAFGQADATSLPIQAPNGNFATAGFGFVSEPNTGFVRSGPGVMQSIVLGNLVSAQSVTGTEFALPISGPGVATGVAEAIADGAPTIQSLPGQSTSSGTAFVFAIPTWAKRITAILYGVSLTGTDSPIIQLGTSGGFISTGYIGGITIRDAAGAISGANSTGGIIAAWGAGAVESGTSTMVLERSGTSNTWAATVLGTRTTSGAYNGQIFGSGSITLGGPLTQIQLTRTGTDTFDVGSIVVNYE